MQIGLLFGSFNPVHHGHLMLAQHMATEEGLDEVWMVLSPLNPFKQSQRLADTAHRLAMLHLALENQTQIKLCTAELHLPVPGYTIHTMEWLSEHYPEHRFSILMGTDNWVELPHWKAHQKLLEHYRLLIYPRPGVDTRGITHPHLRVTHAPLLEISSSQIRKRVECEKSVQYFVPDKVAAYIAQHQLYRDK